MGVISIVNGDDKPTFNWGGGHHLVKTIGKMVRKKQETCGLFMGFMTDLLHDIDYILS